MSQWYPNHGETITRNVDSTTRNDFSVAYNVNTIKCINKWVTHQGETITRYVDSNTRNDFSVTCNDKTVTCINKSVTYQGESVKCNAVTTAHQAVTTNKAVAAFHRGNILAVMYTSATPYYKTEQLISFDNQLGITPSFEIYWVSLKTNWVFLNWIPINFLFNWVLLKLLNSIISVLGVHDCIKLCMIILVSKHLLNIMHLTKYLKLYSQNTENCIDPIILPGFVPYKQN